DRIVLWKAAVDMTLESPLLGKGFKAFRLLKSDYTERPVPVSDTHNMYLFISSQMGIPALILFILIIYKLYSMSAFLVSHSRDEFVRAIGIGGAAMAGSVAAVNVFGSRMVNIEVCGYFWIYLAVIMHLIYKFKNNNQQINENEKIRYPTQ
ncbi:MAG: O-antigen ligase family protein, partial [Thiohalomonadales bacterium]